MFWVSLRKWESILFQKPFELCKLPIKIYSGLIRFAIQVGTEFRSFSVHKIFIPHQFIWAHLWLTFIYAKTQHGMLTLWTCFLVASFMSDSRLPDDFFFLTTAKANCTNCICLMSIDYCIYIIFNLENENVAWIQIHVNA